MSSALGRTSSRRMTKNAIHYWYSSFYACIYFLAIFLQHIGPGSTFKFEWIFGNVTNYIPSDAQNGTCQLFNLDSVSDDGGFANCLAGQNESDIGDYCENMSFFGARCTC